MVEVGTVASYAEIIGAILVVGGLGFAVLELRRGREQKRREAAYEVMRHSSDERLLRASRVLYGMPEGLAKEELEQRYGDDLDDIKWCMFQFEHLGVMVHDHVVPLDMAFSFAGVTIQNTWFKMRGYIEALRAESGKPKVYEYVQWLAERMKELEPDAIPVYETSEKWRPR